MSTSNNAELRAFICPHCEMPATARVQGKAVWGGYNPHTGDQEDPVTEYALVQCDRCGSVSVQAREDYGPGFEFDEPAIVYPAPRRLNYIVPEPLRKEWEEARTCLDAKAFTACVVMVRRTLEGTCQDQGIRERTLLRSLEELRKRDLIDDTLAQWANAMRIVGNEGAHYTGRAVAREDAEDALSFAEALLDHLYVLRKRFDQFQARLAARKEKNSPGKRGS